MDGVCDNYNVGTIVSGSYYLVLGIALDIPGKNTDSVVIIDRTVLAL